MTEVRDLPRSGEGTARRCDDPEILAALHAINQANVPAVGDIPITRMEHFATVADRFTYLGGDPGRPEAGRPVGFLIALTPEADYGSPNFLWFREREASFLYVDRIAVEASARRAGAGRRLYDDLFARARAAGVPQVTCEVNLEPRNDVSLAFHESLGFRPVGEAFAQGHRVAYLACSIEL